MLSPPFTHSDYTVGWICPLEIEQIAATEMLDQQHSRLVQPATDSNAYTLGSIQNHNIVIAGVPTTGNCSTATVIAHMKSTFPCIRFGLLVGIAGGVPTRTDAGQIKLGHVIVSKPTGQHSGTIQYDRGKAEASHFERTGTLAPPPNVLLNAAQQLAVTRARSRSNIDILQEHLRRIDTSIRGLKRYRYPGRGKDHLYQADYIHIDKSLSCQKCRCDANQRVIQAADGDESDESDDAENDEQYVIVHRGTIASGELVMRNGKQRDELAKVYNVLCFETEAAGALNDFPCIVIRGISDYADSHKNDAWHGYAAATAAAYARELFFHMPVAEVKQCNILESEIKELVISSRNLASSAEKTSIYIDAIGTKQILNKLVVADGATFDAFDGTDELNSVCLENTRLGLLEDLRQWINDPQGKSLFWLNGMAGTGKSTISRTLAKEFAREELTNTPRLGASFFFKEGESDRGSAKRFYTTIAAQLAQSFPILVPCIKEALELDPQVVNKTANEQFQKLILNPLVTIKDQIDVPTTIVIIVDALDECKPDSHVKIILDFFSKLRNLQPLQVRTFFTSRPEQVVKTGFQDIKSGYHDIVLHDIEKSIITQDIDIFLRHRFEQIRKKNEDILAVDWPGKEALSILAARAQPLFIYAATVCRFIDDTYNDPESRLQAILLDQDEEAYDNLHQIYKFILLKRKKNSTSVEQSRFRENFQLIVGSIVVLSEPLSVNALAALLRVEARHVVGLLRGLHSVINVSKSWDSPIRTLHLSFANFLLEPSHNKHEFWLDSKEIHKELANRCLDVLIQADCLAKGDICQLEQPGTLRLDVPDSLVNDHLAPEIQYASRHWVHHLKESKSEVSSFVKNVSKLIEDRFLPWFEALSLIGRASEMTSILSELSTLFCGSSGLGVWIRDARRFALTNSYIANESPLQLYCSSIIFAPHGSLIRTKFGTPSWLKKTPKVTGNWSRVLYSFGGQTDLVTSVAFSPDGKQVAAGFDGNTIKLWDVATGALQQTLEGHTKHVKCVTFSPNGTLASLSEDSTIKLWDINVGALLYTLEKHSRVSGPIAFSPDGMQLASCHSDHTVKFWNASTGVLQQTLEGHGDTVTSLAFSLDGKLASSSDDRTIKLWDVATGVAQWTVNRYFSRTTSLAFSPDGKKLASSSYYPGVKIWNATNGAPLHSIETHAEYIDCVKFSPDGLQLASGSRDREIKLWDVATWNLQQTLLGHSGNVCCVAFSPDGKQLVSGSGDRTIKLWDISLNPLDQALTEERTSRINLVMFSPNGEQLACSYEDGTIKLWDVATEVLLMTLEGYDHSWVVMAFSPDGKQLALACYGRAIKLWNIATGLLQQTPKDADVGTFVSSLAFSPDSKTLAFATNATDSLSIKLWNVATGRLQQISHGEKDDVRLAFSPDGKHLASGCTELREPKLKSYVTIMLWDIATKSLVQTFERHLLLNGPIVFSPDGKLLALGSPSQMVCVWHVASGLLLQTFKFDYAVKRISFHNILPLLYTNLGIVKLGLNSASQSSASEEDPEFLAIVDEWLMRGGKRILWLPAEYRARFDNVQYDIKGNIVAFGTALGHLHFLELSSTAIEKFGWIRRP